MRKHLFKYLNIVKRFNNQHEDINYKNNVWFFNQ